MADALRIVCFHAWSYLGVPLVEALVRRVPDTMLLVAPATDREEPKLVQAAADRQIRRLVAPAAGSDGELDLSDPAFLAEIEAFRPDLLVVITFPCKLPDALLRLARLDAINLHPSYLPRHRGAMPEFWVIRNDEAETGVTFHRMTEVFDAGAILAQRRIPLLPQDTQLTLTERMYEPTWELLLELLDGYRKGHVPVGEQQDPAAATRAPLVRDNHLRIDWNESARSIDCLLRAAHSSVPVTGRLNDRELVIRQARVVQGPTRRPGEVTQEPDRLLVAASAGLLDIVEAELDGVRLPGIELVGRI